MKGEIIKFLGNNCPLCNTKLRLLDNGVFRFYLCENGYLRFPPPDRVVCHYTVGEDKKHLIEFLDNRAIQPNAKYEILAPQDREG